MMPIISVGMPVDAKPANVDFAGRPMVPVSAPAPGTDRLTVMALPMSRPGWFALSTNRAMVPGVTPEGEAVFVVRWEGQTAILDQPLQTNWRGDAVLVDVPFQDHVRVKGVKLKGLDLFLCVNAIIEDVEIESGWDESGRPWAISNHFGRNNTFKNIKINPSINFGPGRGYGLHEQQSIGTKVFGLVASGIRHPMPVFGGANGLLDGLNFSNPKGTGIDLHGYGSVGYTFRNCVLGGSDASVGNKYPYGDSAVTLENVSGGKTLYAYGATSVTIRNWVGDGPLVAYANEAGPPNEINVTDSTFKPFSDGNWFRFMGAGPFTTKVTLKNVSTRQ